jgi:hypothetical protein
MDSMRLVPASRVIVFIKILELLRSHWSLHIDPKNNRDQQRSAHHGYYRYWFQIHGLRILTSYWLERLFSVHMHLSQIHERAISLTFLGIILRVLILEVSVYNVYITNQFQTTSAQGGRGKIRNRWLWIARRKTLKTIVPITSKDSASGRVLPATHRERLWTLWIYGGEVGQYLADFLCSQHPY